MTVTSSSRILPTLTTRLLALSAPTRKSTLQRFLLDALWRDPDQSADGASTGWHVVLKDSLGSTLATFDLPTQGTATTKERVRFVQSVFSEVTSDCQVIISIPGGAPRFTQAELYTGLIEFQPASPSLPSYAPAFG